MKNLFFLVLSSLFLGANLIAQSVTPWLTRGDQSALLSQRSAVSFTTNTNSISNTITLQSTTSQVIDGFGFCLTQASAQVIFGLNSTKQNQLLQELFGSNGLGISAIRISIGASDLSNSVYSYNETSGDVNMNNFSLNGPDKTYLIPILDKILNINPDIKILATPWTAPTWMKTNNDWTGGSLRTDRYDAYARYFVKYLEKMNDEGITIWGITPQNEPENGNNEPSMLMTSGQQKTFINNHLGPQIANSPFSPKIIAFDHNCDNTSYPIDVLNNSGYVDGAAFHLYGGNISAMSQVHNATGKNVYFTEQYTDSGGSFNGDFGWHMRNVVIGSINNFSKTVFEWNLAADSNNEPRTPGGCTECLPAITIPNSNNYSPNVSYYIIGQVAKFVKPGAVRINSSNNNNELYSTAFENPNGERVVVAYNDASGNKSVRVIDGNKSFDYTISGKSAVTLVWSPDVSYSGYYNVISRRSGKGLDVAGNSSSNNANVEQYAISNGGGDNQRWEVIDLGNGYYNIKAKHSGRCLSQRTNNNHNVVQQSCNGFNRQQWQFIDVGNGYFSLKNRRTGRRLDVSGNSTANNANIQTWTNTNNTNQQWRFDQVETNTNLSVGENIKEELNDQLNIIDTEEVVVFPNPVNNELTVNLPEFLDLKVAKLFDEAGRLVLELNLEPATTQLQLKIAELANGIYFLRLSSASDMVIKQIIKN